MCNHGAYSQCRFGVAYSFTYIFIYIPKCNNAIFRFGKTIDRNIIVYIGLTIHQSFEKTHLLGLFFSNQQKRFLKSGLLSAYFQNNSVSIRRCIRCYEIAENCNDYGNNDNNQPPESSFVFFKPSPCGTIEKTPHYAKCISNCRSLCIHL